MFNTLYGQHVLEFAVRQLGGKDLRQASTRKLKE